MSRRHWTYSPLLELPGFQLLAALVIQENNHPSCVFIVLPPFVHRELRDARDSRLTNGAKLILERVATGAWDASHKLQSCPSPTIATLTVRFALQLHCSQLPILNFQTSLHTLSLPSVSF